MHNTQKILFFHHLAIIAGLLYYGFNIQYAVLILIGCILWAYIVGHKGLHIYLAHHDYKDNIKSYLYTIGALVTGVGSPLMFAATHRQHHKFHDTEKDPHSPEHIGWLNVWFMNYNSQHISPRLVRDYLKSNFQKFMNRHWMKLTVAMIVVLGLIDPRIVCFIIRNRGLSNICIHSSPGFIHVASTFTRHVQTCFVIFNYYYACVHRDKQRMGHSSCA